MSVSNGESANAATFNNAFVSKETDSTTTAELTLADSSYSTAVSSVQDELLSIANFSGKTVNSGSADIPSWTDSNIGASTDSLFTKVDSIDLKFDGTAASATSGGHRHDGTDGQGPRIAASALTGTNGLLATSAQVGFMGTTDQDFSGDKSFLGSMYLNNSLILEETTQSGNGTYNSLDATNTSFIRFSTDSGIELNGIAGDGINGQVVFITAPSADAFNVNNESGSTAASNRIATPGEENIGLGPGGGAIFLYNDNRWSMIGGGGGGGGGGALYTTTNSTSASAALITGGITYSHDETRPRQLIFVLGGGGVSGASGHIDVSTEPQISNGTTNGFELILIGTKNDATVLLTPDSALSLNGDMVLSEDSSLHLVWDEPGNKWIEIARRA